MIGLTLDRMRLWWLSKSAILFHRARATCTRPNTAAIWKPRGSRPLNLLRVPRTLSMACRAKKMRRMIWWRARAGISETWAARKSRNWWPVIRWRLPLRLGIAEASESMKLVCPQRKFRPLPRWEVTMCAAHDSSSRRPSSWALASWWAAKWASVKRRILPGTTQTCSARKIKTL